MRRLAYYLLYALSGAILALFLVGYSARYVHPHYAWWAELVAIGLPYLAVAVVASAAVTAAARAWRLLAVHAVVLLLLVVRFGLPLPLLEAGEADADDLTVLTFNVPRWGDASEQSKIEGMRALVRRTAPELIALQEAPTAFDGDGGFLQPGTQSYVGALTGAPLDYRTANARTSGRTEQPVLGRVALYDLSQKTLRVGNAEQDITYVVRTGFEWQGRRAVLYNVHLRSFGPSKPWHAEDPHLFDLGFWKPYLRQYRRAYRARAREVERIRAMLDQETLPVIIAGDFNSTPHSWAYRQLGVGMKDAFHLAGSGWGSTYHSQLPFARIDFVLASEEWDVVSARVPDTDLSDHRPMVATLRWKNRE